MDERLVARDVWKSYRTEGGELRVLAGVDLDVRAGEIVAIVGVSGVGKSTLLHVLGGLDHADRGEVRLGGTLLAGLAPEALAAVRNRTVGFVFQFHNLLPEFTALENVMMPLLIRRTPREEARAKALGVLKELGLANRLDHIPARLSGGEQQRVAIGRALVGSPSLVLADEPTGNLDPGTGAAVFELLRRLSKARGMACVVATHNEALAKACDKIVHLCEGRLRELTSGASPPDRWDDPTPPVGA